MPTFVISSVPDVLYRGKTIENRPVNITHCWTFEPVKIAWYPDNIGLPGIRFRMTEKEHVEWVYPDEAKRDADLARLTARFGEKLNNADW